MNKSELNKIFKIVKPGLDKSASIESMTYFFFSGKELVTYNSMVSIQYPLKTEFKCFVSAKTLMGLLSKVVSDELTFSLKDDKLNVKATGININLPTIFDSEVVDRIKKVNKSIKEVEWTTLPSNFQESILLCQFAASKQDSDGTLTCVHIKEKVIQASNNKQIAISTIDKKMEEILLPSSCLKDLLEINPTDYATSKSWVHFKNAEGCVFSIRKIKGDYPNFEKFFDFKGAKIELTSSVTEGIDIASVLKNEENPFIKVSVEENKCTISVKSAMGSMKHSTEIKYKGEEVSFVIHPEFLKEMMAHSTTIIVDKVKAMITSGDFKIVTALMTMD